MECYSAFKRKEVLIPAITGMDFEDIMLNEISQSEDDKCYLIHFCKILRIVKIKEMEEDLFQNYAFVFIKTGVVS